MSPEPLPRRSPKPACGLFSPEEPALLFTPEACVNRSTSISFFRNTSHQSRSTMPWDRSALVKAEINTFILKRASMWNSLPDHSRLQATTGSSRWKFGSVPGLCLACLQLTRAGIVWRRSSTGMTSRAFGQLYKSFSEVRSTSSEFGSGVSSKARRHAFGRS